jgi:hypothetical protein
VVVEEAALDLALVVVVGGTRPQVSIFILKPEAIHVHRPPMFIPPEEVIYHDRPTLRYHVLIDILEVVDWHVPSEDSLFDDDLESPFDDLSRAHHRSLSRLWPKRLNFLEHEQEPEDDALLPLIRDRE